MAESRPANIGFMNKIIKQLFGPVGLTFFELNERPTKTPRTNVTIATTDIATLSNTQSSIRNLSLKRESLF